MSVGTLGFSNHQGISSLATMLVVGVFSMLEANVVALPAISKQPVHMRLRAFGNVVRSDFAPKWALKFTIQLLFPK